MLDGGISPSTLLNAASRLFHVILDHFNVVIRCESLQGIQPGTIERRSTAMAFKFLFFLQFTQPEISRRAQEPSNGKLQQKL